ncbi:class II aldolase/adducin family protein [Marinithermus hydrothermalis]|nr:class II aldolase/adducin family protein [Marinithermus hydrothermalis]
MTETLYAQFRQVGADLFAQRLISAKAGNFSVRTETGLIITKSGTLKGRLEPEDLLELGLDPNPERDQGASIETVIHREIYRQTDARAVVHAHPRTAVALSLHLEVIRPVDLEGRYYMPEVPVLAPKTVSATPEAARAVAEALRTHPVCVLKGHGAFAKGRDLVEAYTLITVLEESAEILLYSKLWSGRS